MQLCSMCKGMPAIMTYAGHHAANQQPSLPCCAETGFKVTPNRYSPIVQEHAATQNQQLLTCEATMLAA